jgi:ribosome recycling factor
MSPDQIVGDAKTKFSTAVSHFEAELKKVRTGRAQPSMLDGVMIQAYGQSMPLNQVATIATPEAQLLQVTPFDPNNLQAIASAIRDNPTLGLNPMDDGRVVRLPIPPLTEERRREYAKSIGEKTEECMVGLRAIRHAALRAIDQAKKDKAVSEDEAKRFEKQVDDAMNQAKAGAEVAAKSKEAEVMTV